MQQLNIVCSLTFFRSLLPRTPLADAPSKLVQVPSHNAKVAELAQRGQDLFLSLVRAAAPSLLLLPRRCFPMRMRKALRS